MKPKTIRSIIHKKIRSTKCNIKYVNQTQNNMPACYYDAFHRCIYISTSIKKYQCLGHDFQWRKVHALLHEVCHDLTWNNEWSKSLKNNWPIKPINRSWHPTIYLAEYKAEKLLRRISKHNNWYDILKISNTIILYTISHIFNDEVYKRIDPHYDIYGWVYAAKRIIREEPEIQL